MKKSLIILLLVTLTACGFKLRSQISTLPFDTLYVSAPAGHPIGSDISRAIDASTTTQVISKIEDAQAILQIIRPLNERRILSLSGGGRVREFQLVFRVTMRLVDTNGIEIIPTDEIVLSRILPFLDAQILAKEAEAEMLFKNMQDDAVQQIIWRLSSVKSLPKRIEANAEAEVN